MTTPATNSGTPTPSSVPPAGKTDGKAAPMFSIEANSPRELALRVAQAILKTGAFITVEKTDADGKAAGKYAIWNLDDSGKVTQSPYPSLTLTTEEAQMLPTDDGMPVVLGVAFALKQLAPKSALASRIAERRMATATRSAANAGRASTDDLLAELRRRGVKVEDSK